jgi:coenzyme F420-reducing hydrogenase delta subunit
MLHQLVKTFYLGQVAAEYVLDASKKSIDSVVDQTREYQEISFPVTIQNQIKEKLAHLRKCSQPFERLCTDLSRLLVETSEIRDKLIASDSGS